MVVGCCAHKGRQYCQYSSMLSRSPVIVKDAKPEISDASLTLNSRKRQ